MSRRITLLVLAASAALIATQAFADPECFGDSCRLPEVSEPPAAAVQPPDADETPLPEASVAAPKTAPAKLRPLVAAEPAAEPVEPAARRPLRPVQTLADETGATREPRRLAPRTAKAAPAPAYEPAPADYARSVRVSSPDPSYVVSQNAAVAGVVVVVPGAHYAAHRPSAFMIAPNAKIISIDGDD